MSASETPVKDDVGSLSFSKLGRWNWRLLIGVAAGLAVAVVGLALSTWHLSKVYKEERATREAATQRAQEAKASFQLAGQAADDYYLKLSQDPRLLGNFLALRKELLQAAVPYYEKLMTLQSEDPEVQADLGRSCMQWAHLTREIGDSAKAITLYLQAYDIFDRLVLIDGPKPAYVSNKAKCHIMVGSLYRETGELEAAQRILQDANLHLGWLIANAPDWAEYPSDQAILLDNLASIYFANGETEEALNACRECLKFRERMYAEHPDVNEYLRDLIKSHDNLGAMYRDLHQWEEAQRTFQNARQIRRRLCSEHPEVTQYQQELALNYHNLAGVSALAAAAVATDTHLPQAERNKLAEDYAARAVDELRQAIAKGYNDIDSMRKDKNFDSLRGRADFKQLLADLEAKRKAEPK